MVVPIFIGVISHFSSGQSLSIGFFFKSIFEDVNDNVIFLLIPTIALLVGIWLFGGIAGQLIIDKGKSEFKYGFLTVFMLWILLFISSTLSAAIENSVTWGLKGFGGAIIGWLVYGLFLFLILGIIHGLIMGYFIGKEIKIIGENAKQNANNGYN